jgi:hypothetical protein
MAGVFQDAPDYGREGRVGARRRDEELGPTPVGARELVWGNAIHARLRPIIAEHGNKARLGGTDVSPQRRVLTIAGRPRSHRRRP